MKIPIYQIDAFTDVLFRGNPAAVCPLEEWPKDERLQAVAAENNLSETAFFVKKEEHYELRWFTPAIEVNLCGHATLAAAFVIFNYLDDSLSKVRFSTKSGMLTVEREDPLLSMNFPARPASACDVPADLVAGLRIEPEEVSLSEDYMAVYDSAEKIASLKPDMNRLLNIGGRGVIATAPGEDVDFVSRFFAPKAGIPEDPVTGSTHSTLVPYWSKRLGKKKLHARQLSRRGGELFCEDLGERVKIAGHAVMYMEGFINL